MSEHITGHAHRAQPDLLIPQAVLSRTANDLAAKYTGVFSAQTVERYIYESYAALRRTARIHTHLTSLAARFARDRLTALAQARGRSPEEVPEVLFVCVHNAGRSQMAAALLNHHAAGRVHVRSAGSAPAHTINPHVVEVMAEIGLDLGSEYPKPLTDDVVAAADVVVSMGCGEACAVYPGKRYLDWTLADPDTASLEVVRQIRDDLDARVRGLLAEMTNPPGAGLTAAARTRPSPRKGFALMASRPSVLFVCVHNAGRSQMAAGFLTHLAGGSIEVRSAGSAPAATINSAAVEAMAEVGIDISQQSPKILTTDAVESSDVVITMGCGDACPVFPGINYRDWALPDPAGKSLEAVRPIRDEIKSRVQALITELLPGGAAPQTAP